MDIRVSPLKKIKFFPNIGVLSTKDFSFLNKRVPKKNIISQWYVPGQSALWNYNLNYFDFLFYKNDYELLEVEYLISLIKDWACTIKESSHIGLAPYPTSLRIVNWIKFENQYSVFDNDVLTNLYYQVKYLENNIEYHVQGNHLIANAKALIFAGEFFEGDCAKIWLNKGLKILKKEIDEQIQNGLHYERSLMYHAIILEDLIDIYLICPDSQRMVLSQITNMGLVLNNLSHKDGSLPFFNDVVAGIAHPVAFLIDKIEKDILKKELPKNCQKKSSGFFTHEWSGKKILVDCSCIGPNYITGHTHNDALSFELSDELGKIFTNRGTSTYNKGERRNLERSVSCHNTVSIDLNNHYEVWDSFRVARRAKTKIMEAKYSNSSFYCRARLIDLPKEKSNIFIEREYETSLNEIVISDRTNKHESTLVSFFHLDVNLKVSVIDGQAYIYRSKKMIGKLTAMRGEVSISETLHSVGYNCLKPAFTIIVTGKYKNKVRICFV